MITRIEIDGYKSFEGFALDLPSFGVLLGTNASGKSNLLEAVDLLGQLIREPEGQTLVDRARRGGPKELFRRSPAGRPADTLRITADVIVDGPRGYCFLRVVALVRYADPPQPLDVTVEVGNVRDHYGDSEWREYADSLGLPPEIRGNSMRELHATRVPVQDSVYGPELAAVSRNWRIVEPSPKAMRVASSTYDTAPLAEDGKNLGAVLGRISRNPESWYDFRADAVALLPDLADITVEANEEWGQWDVWLQHKHEHRVSPGTASAGTLRVLALLAAAHDPAHEGVLMFEEPENGLHPSRVPHLLSRLRGRTSNLGNLSSGDGRQTLITSHSPIALAAALDEAPESVVFLDTVTRFGDGLPPRRLTRARKVAAEGERGTFVTPLEVRKYLDPVGRYARGA
ncbi:AAA family ATPase [Streptomyces xinghaiensis]|uniref:AAA family ATPase n=1 Tax=Streptomyces xinghaiensis TaxID=1038928 RepID=UPI0002FF0E0C|nr:ATP-binding protein [Streptomyces xinghaiensis]MZE81210.1 AAA family ATPase [Streptomyces sp. SID5475]